jgi:hypothetical protein
MTVTLSATVDPMTDTGKPDTYRPFTEQPPEDGRCGDPVGALEMSERLGVKDRSIHMMRRRGQLPEPDYGQVNGSRAWEWGTVLWWAGETGRLRSPKLVTLYREMFKCDPPNGTHRSAPGVTTRPDKRSATPKLPSRDEVSARRQRVGTRG